MRTELSAEAQELGEVLDGALRRAGGVDLARSVASPADVGRVTDLLERLGVLELRPRESADDAEAAAAVCRSAGRVVLPYPVAERLAGAPEQGLDAVAVVTGRPRIALAGLVPDLQWAALDGAGRRAPVTSVGPALGTQLGTLVHPVEVGAWEPDPEDLTPLALTLSSWVMLGTAEAVVAATRQHLLDRHQFGQPLASFQALQFRLADTATALQGLQELAKYTLWSVTSGQPGALVDALGCRLAALEVSDTVFRNGHQAHGAMGFCDEVDLSWFSRMGQPVRRLPWGRSQTQERLLAAMQDAPFAGLFGDGLAGAGSRELGSTVADDEGVGYPSVVDVPGAAHLLTAQAGR